MRRLLSIIISLITVMAFAQQPVESTSNESDPMLRIGKSYLGTRYVANTLDRNEVEQLVINTKECSIRMVYGISISSIHAATARGADAG